MRIPSLVAALLLTAAPLTAQEARDVRRARQFHQLWEPGDRDALVWRDTAAPEGSISGMVEGGSVSLHESTSWISGSGPHGVVSLSIFGTNVSGSSGGQPVSLRSSNGWISGSGPHGHVSLTFFGNTISGTVGGQSVQVHTSNGWASGNFRGTSFTVSFFGSTRTDLVAILLGSL